MAGDPSNDDLRSLRASLDELRQRIEAIEQALPSSDSPAPSSGDDPESTAANKPSDGSPRVDPATGALLDPTTEAAPPPAISVTPAVPTRKTAASEQEFLSQTKQPEGSSGRARGREPLIAPQKPPTPFQQELKQLRSSVAANFVDDGHSDATNQWERFVGGQGMTWLGAAALALAVAFFIPWAWVHFALLGWVRVLIFHLSGVGVLLAALYFRRRDLPLLARGLAGLGIFILYASAFAMEHHYKLWGEQSRLMTLLDCGLITILAILIALRYHSIYVIVLGALGGYFIPLLQRVQLVDLEAFRLTFSYLVFLNVALLVVASIRPWRFLKTLAWIATAVMFLLWGGTGARHVWPYEWMLALHAVVFLLGTNLPAILWRQRTESADRFVLVSNSLAFVGVTWSLFHGRPEQQLALLCWGLSVLHGGLFVLSYYRLTHADRLPRTHLALAIMLFTLAVPLQLRDTLNYLAYAWAIEAFVLTALGIYFRDEQMKVGGIVVMGLAAARVMMFDFFDPAETIGTSDIDRRFLVTLGVGVATLAAGSCYWWVERLAPRQMPIDDGERGKSDLDLARQTGGLLMAVGYVLSMLALTRQFEGRLLLVQWTLAATVLWVVAINTARPAARVFACLVSVAMCGGLAVSLGGEAVGNPSFVFNARLLSLLLLAVLYFVAAWYERRLGAQQSSPTDLLTEGTVGMNVLMHVLGHGVLLAAVTMEIFTFWNPGRVVQLLGHSAQSVPEHASYSVTWGIYAALTVAVGFLLRYRLPRLLGLAGLLLVGLKVLLIDLSSLTLIYRVLCLAALGGLLLVTSYWYQKFATRLEESPAESHT